MTSKLRLTLPVTADSAIPEARRKNRRALNARTPNCSPWRNRRADCLEPYYTEGPTNHVLHSIKIWIRSVPFASKSRLRSLVSSERWKIECRIKQTARTWENEHFICTSTLSKSVCAFLRRFVKRSKWNAQLYLDAVYVCLMNHSLPAGFCEATAKIFLWYYLPVWYVVDRWRLITRVTCVECCMNHM